MTYHQFTVELADNVKKLAGTGVEVEVCNNKKNNGIVRVGLILSEKNVNISPTIYMEEYYKLHQEGCKMEDLARAVLELYENVKFDNSWENMEFNEYESIKDNIVIRLVQKKRNQELLKEIPYIPMLDLAVVFYMILEVTEFGMATMRVSNDTIERWNVNVQQLYVTALMNTQRRLPGEFMTLNDVIGEGEPYVSAGPNMYVLSNDRKSYGAAAILYPGCLKRIGAYLKDDYFIVPSSVHEVIIVPYEEISDSQYLNEMVECVNSNCVTEEEILEDHVYYYRRSKDRIEIC